MLNIISRSLLFKDISGPKKVVESLIRGLDSLGYPCVVNKRLDACERLWIHDDAKAVKKIASLPKEIKVIVGPNVYNLPADIPENIDVSRAVFLQPSEWVKRFWIKIGFNRCPIDVWPAGIDTDEFKPSPGNKETILVYFKIRDRLSEKKILKDELQKIRNVLEDKKLSYKVIVYGNYREENYKDLLSRTRYIIWLGMLETQGLALEEALAMDVPLLACDFSSHFTCISSRQDRYYDVTNVPYFSNDCGIKITDISELESGMDFMENNLGKFRPRKYILENLSLKKKAKDLILLYEKHFKLSYESGFQEKLLKKSDWINNKFYYIFWLKLKSFIKLILIKIGVWKYIRY